METKKSNPIGALLGGAVGGMAVAFLTQRRDRQAGQPSFIEKVKDFESKLYADGRNRAHTFKNIKQEAEVVVTSDTTTNKKSAIH